MIFIGAVILAVVGACGMLTKIVDFIGTDIANGMMAGVGLILTKAAVNMVKEDHIAGCYHLSFDQIQCQYAGLYNCYFGYRFQHCFRGSE